MDKKRNFYLQHKFLFQQDQKHPQRYSLMQKISFWNITIRTMFNSSKNMVSKVVNSTNILHERTLINKCIFINFCNHFKEMSLASLMQDKLFLAWVNKSIHGIPTLQSRAFQLALEVTYHKRRFSQDALEEYYNNDFQIRDIFNVNKGVCDQSTIYSSTLTKLVSNYFNLNKNDLIVNSTPIFLKKNQITHEIQQMIETNRKLTGNSVPDVEIKQTMYDFKESKNVSWNKNHIYFFDMQYIQQEGLCMLNNLGSSINNCIQNKSYTTLAAQQYAIHVLNILKNKNVSIQKTFENIYEFTLKHKPPQDFCIPYITPIKRPNVEKLKTTCSSEEIKNVKLDDGNVIDVKAKAAIESIQENWDPDLKEKVHQAISGSLSHVLSKNDETS